MIRMTNIRGDEVFVNLPHPNEPLVLVQPSDKTQRPYYIRKSGWPAHGGIEKAIILNDKAFKDDIIGANPRNEKDWSDIMKTYDDRSLIMKMKDRIFSYI